MMDGPLFGTPRAWLDYCNRVVRDDHDNLLLYTGPEGSGKSNLALQHLQYADPTFTIDRVYFTIDDFLHGVRHVPRYGAVLLDEAMVNRRRSMHGANIRFLEFLQTCRGLNLHIGLCFPHSEMLDRGILNYRVRWNCHKVRRDAWMLRRRARCEDREHPDAPTYYWARDDGRWICYPVDGPIWGAYLRMKEEAMRKRLDDTTLPEEPPGPGEGESDAEFIARRVGRRIA
jgi:hypothetical protein